MTAQDKADLTRYYEDMSIGGLRANAARAIQDLQSDNLTIENYLPIGTWNLLPESRTSWRQRKYTCALHRRKFPGAQPHFLFL